jgi:hypothetical protein
MKRGNMPIEMLKIVFCISLLMSFISCGDSSSNNSSRQEETNEGVFKAVLNPENPSVSAASGNAEISLIGDDFNVNVTMLSSLSTTHAQHIHTGSRCPTAADDTNGDGFVDSVEASVVYGEVILPLDDDLTSNSGSFPSGPTYNYFQNASYSQILANLNLQTLNFEKLVINIHGVPESTILPPTVQGSKADFPISCGIFNRIIDTTPVDGIN